MVPLFLMTGRLISRVGLIPCSLQLHDSRMDIFRSTDLSHPTGEPELHPYVLDTGPLVSLDGPTPVPSPFLLTSAR